ncbi:MAG: methyltransferase domain-containing protein [Kiritimatiellaeota bacterium]|nr:methyltransferase domain-containing protein [Kiritimatiellota bacterium]
MTEERRAHMAMVKEYYGKVLASKQDLKTSACCTAAAVPPYLREIASALHPEIVERFYGCGSPIPQVLQGAVVLDLGCGTGRDVYLAAKLVGPNGRSLGVDMTEEQLAVARRHLDWQMAQFGFPVPNAEFRHGFIEDLASAGIENESVDVVISNCVINLSPDKAAVFSEILRVLKPGGELLFSDIFADRRLPEALRGDPVLLGECLAGALYEEDFRRLLAGLGCTEYRVVSSREIEVTDPEIAGKIGLARFYSKTIRAFKLASLEDRCEDYGQAARYLGTIPECPHGFRLDRRHFFESGRWAPVCGNTAAVLTETRLAPHFEVRGDRSRHYGLFDCAAGVGPSALPADAVRQGGCC